MSENFQVIIIGAGAAGLMCAAVAAQRGKKVIVLDHANKMAKKVLMSGGGRCNFTNHYIDSDNFISHNPHFCKSALSRYTQWDFISLVEKHNIEYYEKSLGQLFCKKSSRDIRDLLLNECQSVGAKIQLKCTVEAIIANEAGGFNLTTTIGNLGCQSLVIATGGLSIPTMGATGFGYDIAKQFGHKIYPTRAGLTPLTFSPKMQTKFASLAGNSVNVEVSCNQSCFREAMLFTHKGLSGPAILQISSYWQKGDPIHINLIPSQDVKKWLDINCKERAEITLKTLLSTQFSQSIAVFLISELNINCKLKQLSHQQKEQIFQQLTQWTVYPDDVEGYKVAEVTLGGVDTNEISSKTFESQRQPGLYFIGEVLDVTGHLGGYNFQWAWASGYAAGSYV
ncbi:NAD(P)/FAD-dependent oxidoreductase [Aliikangiella sp. IMCC44359]|uniref:NAD(P)/FAD-dependent oxidoreductase n=1 Tax=Aliikangiella sp. IMCC44359 TaxID=3459125 RepID=UPI00403ADB0D